MMIEIKSIQKYNAWCKQPLSYEFKHMFYMFSVIYSICTLYDFTLTYITFRLSPNGFFRYEISLVIKEVFSGNILFCIPFVVLFFMPLIVVYYLNIYFVKHYGYSVNGIRPVLYAVYFVCLLHIIGGLTNFFNLINMR